MRAGKLARWVGRLASVAVFGAAAVLGGVVWAHADDEPAQPDPAKWESEDTSGDDPADSEGPDSDGADSDGADSDGSDSDESDSAKWESGEPGPVFAPLSVKWE